MSRRKTHDTPTQINALDDLEFGHVSISIFENLQNVYFFIYACLKCSMAQNTAHIAFASHRHKGMQIYQQAPDIKHQPYLRNHANGVKDYHAAFRDRYTRLCCGVHMSKDSC